MGAWLGLFLNITVAVVFPLGVLFYFISRKKELAGPFLLGAATFFVFQMLIRVPLLELVLKKQLWFQGFKLANPWLYLLLLALSAGIAEEVGRFITIRFFMKNQLTWQSGVAFGLGHGGLEALLLVGLTNIGLLLTPSTVAMLSFGQVALAGVERISAMVLHVGWSLLVLEGVRKNNKKYLLFAVLTHGIVDFTIGAMAMLGIVPWLIELALLVTAMSALVFIAKYSKARKEAENK